MSRSSSQLADAALNVANKIKPLLAGLDPAVQGAALAELLSVWLAGHPEEVRETVLQLHIEMMRPLIETNAKIIRGQRPN